MKVTVLKKDKRFDSVNNNYLGVQSFGENNDYPQQVKMIVDASGTAVQCVDIYAKFIAGKGFFDADFYKKVVNRKGQTNDYILEQISKDFALFGGFAIHVNYNANLKITSLQHIPFEQVRFEKMNDKGVFEKIAVHPDWTKQFTKLRKWRKEDIELIPFFDPLKVQDEVDACGGWLNYNGQVFYFSRAGERTYPLPKFDAVLTDMNTEEGISNVNNRNVRNNFLPAGMLVDIFNSDESEEQENDTEKSLLNFQGDENAGKMLYVQVEDESEVPKYVPFKSNNYDKEFTVTKETVQDNIGQAFNIPPILRAKDVGANFGADLMTNAYNYFNSVTVNERMSVMRVFTEIFRHWHEAITTDFTIEPLSYDVETTLAERLGDKGFEQLMKILENDSMQPIQKRNIIRTLFSLSDEEITALIPIQ